MSNDISRENLLYSLPDVLKTDGSTEALGQTAAELFAARLNEIDRLRIISNIDALDEEALDILAHDFKVDWWDGDYSLEEKRKTLKTSWKVHKKLGTKAAIEAAIQAIYPETSVRPWFEYGGEPYHFELTINISRDSGDKKRQKRVLERLNYYKSLRDTLDAMLYFLRPDKGAEISAGGLYTGRHEKQFTAVIALPELEKPTGRRAVLCGGGLVGFHQQEHITVAMELEESWQGGEAQAVVGGKMFQSYQQDDCKIN